MNLLTFSLGLLSGILFDRLFPLPFLFWYCLLGGSGFFAIAASREARKYRLDHPSKTLAVSLLMQIDRVSVQRRGDGPFDIPLLEQCKRRGLPVRRKFFSVWAHVTGHAIISSLASPCCIPRIQYETRSILSFFHSFDSRILYEACQEDEERGGLKNLSRRALDGSFF